MKNTMADATRPLVQTDLTINDIRNTYKSTNNSVDSNIHNVNVADSIFDS